MTAGHQAPPAPPLEPASGSTLDDLLSRLDAAKAEMDDAKKKYEALRDKIKDEIWELRPGAEYIPLRSQYLAKPMRLVARPSWNLNTAALKQGNPEIYVRYAERKTTWYLEADRRAQS